MCKPSGHCTYNVRTLYVHCTYIVRTVPLGRFKSFLSFLYNFVTAKLVTSSKRANNENILYEIYDKWKENVQVDQDTLSVSHSLILYNNSIEDTYLKCILFRTLHRKFFTNEKLLYLGFVETGVFYA